MKFMRPLRGLEVLKKIIFGNFHIVQIVGMRIRNAAELSLAEN